MSSTPMVLVPFPLAALAAAPVIGAAVPAIDAFKRDWARTDRPVADGKASHTWMWGPGTITLPFDCALRRVAGQQRHPPVLRHQPRWGVCCVGEI